jgi:hypothetical protein
MITIEALNVHGGKGSPEDIAQAVRNALNTELEAAAIHMGAA